MLPRASAAARRHMGGIDVIVPNASVMLPLTWLSPSVKNVPELLLNPHKFRVTMLWLTVSVPTPSDPLKMPDSQSVTVDRVTEILPVPPPAPETLLSMQLAAYPVPRPATTESVTTMLLGNPGGAG